MSVNDNDFCECEHFEEGDWVESRLNSNIFGIVISESDFGRFYSVQLAGSLEINSFHGVTLRHMDGAGDEGNGRAAPMPDDDNVVRVDFTKGRDLTKDTTTEGAA